jgi:trans-2,3-dihydro-3-hydroxyanthranilate isomerase
MNWRYVTVDVFTGRQFGGNPLAVFTDARGLTDVQMQALAFELNLSETTFVLPPDNPTNSARVRIFNRTAEMAFAGHPSIGTAYVLACASHPHGDRLKLEVPAGVVDVEIERTDGTPVGGKITAPQPLSLGRAFPSRVIAACLGITSDDIITATHAPMLASVGNPYIIAELTPRALERCSLDLNGFKAAYDGGADLRERFSVYVYARHGDDVRARMFAPLSGTYEDPATGSAATPLAGLLLHHSNRDELAFVIHQGEYMKRPSLMHVTARKDGEAIRTTVAGRCVPVMEGIFNPSNSGSDVSHRPDVTSP